MGRLAYIEGEVKLSLEKDDRDWWSTRKAHSLASDYFEGLERLQEYANSA